MRALITALAALAALEAMPAASLEGSHRPAVDVAADPEDSNDSLPAYFPDAVACPRGEPREVVNQCIEDNLRAMLPHLNEGGRVGLPSLEPYFVPEIKVDFHSYIADFHAIVSEMNVTGLSKMSILDARADLRDDSMRLAVDVFLPVMAYRGHFEFTNGFFSSMWRFKGHGPFEIIFRNISASWMLEGKKQPGSKYMTIVKGSPTYSVGGMRFWAKNLVEGYPSLDDIVISVANRLWRDVVRFGKPALQQEFSEQLRALSDAVFRRVPYDAVFPPGTPGAPCSETRAGCLQYYV